MKIYGNRGHFYQWEHDQLLIVEEDCTEIQYFNGTLPNALCCRVKEKNGVRVADVPNDLLQTAADLHAYAWDENTRCIVRHQVFGVEAKAKPDDYVYTQTDVLRYRDIVELTAAAAANSAAAAEQAKQSAGEAQKVVAAYEAGELNGPKGDPGRTPVRGTDYWTPADQAEIKAYVDNAILGGKW